MSSVPDQSTTEDVPSNAAPTRHQILDSTSPPDASNNAKSSLNPSEADHSRSPIDDDISKQNTAMATQEAAETNGGDAVQDHIDSKQDQPLPEAPSTPPPPPKDDLSDQADAGPGPSSLVLTYAAEDMDSTKVWSEKEGFSTDSSLRDAHTPDLEFVEKQKAGEPSEESRPEIQNILQQFDDNQQQQNDSTAMTPTKAELPIFHYPPRVSSLENFTSPTSPSHPGEVSFPATSSQDPEKASLASLSHAPSIASQPPPPEPDPEPDLPFDFHRFLEQLRHRTADPVAKFLRSFLMEFGKKQWQVHEQVKIINDFLTFISSKMGQCEVWRSVSDAEFDNAREGMEKLVMNRLYIQTFSPEIPPPEPSSSKSRRKGGATTPVGQGRRGQHQEDVERDEVLAQKVRIYGWIREEHLDITPFGDKGRKFVLLAQQELSKIKSYRAPRDKVICVLNCCKVLFGFLRHAQSDQSADEFIPLLIYTVLKSNPDHLVSNVQYILRFRNQDKLGGEAGYYMSSLMGAIQFIENLDRTNLTISDEEFEQNVEAAVSSIAERPEQQSDKRQTSSHPHFNEKSALSRPEVTTRHSLEGERSSPRRMPQRPSDTNSGDESDENAAVAGLLRTIQKPLSTIGRIFSEDTPSPPLPNSSKPPSTPQPNVRPPRTSSIPQTGAAVGQAPQPAAANAFPAAAQTAETARLEADVAAARQASAETAQAQQVMRAEHQTVVDTLVGMFPALDRDVISDVVTMKEGQVGQAVDACLALSR